MTDREGQGAEGADEGRVSDSGAAAAGSEGADDELGLEGRLKRLDQIVAALEGDEVDLDRALSLFEEGVGHVRAAEKALAEAELRVEELLGDGEDAETREMKGSSE